MATSSDWDSTPAFQVQGLPEYLNSEEDVLLEFYRGDDCTAGNLITTQNSNDSGYNFEEPSKLLEDGQYSYSTRYTVDEISSVCSSTIFNFDKPFAPVFTLYDDPSASAVGNVVSGSTTNTKIYLEGNDFGPSYKKLVSIYLDQKCLTKAVYQTVLDEGETSFRTPNYLPPIFFPFFIVFLIMRNI